MDGAGLTGVGLTGLFCLALGTMPGFAQTAPDPAPAPMATVTAADTGPAALQAVTATVGLEVLAPMLDEAGKAVLDVAGEPILAFRPVGDAASLLPGDEFRYIVTVTSEGPEVNAMEIGLDVPAAGRLLAETVTASVDASFMVGSSTDKALRAPLFVEVDGQDTANPEWAASPESYDQIFATIDRIAPESSMTVTYHLVVR